MSAKKYIFFCPKTYLMEIYLRIYVFYTEYYDWDFHKQMNNSALTLPASLTLNLRRETTGNVYKVL
jgi:hypothetical protein